VQDSQLAQIPNPRSPQQYQAHISHHLTFQLLGTGETLTTSTIFHGTNNKTLHMPAVHAGLKEPHLLSQIVLTLPKRLLGLNWLLEFKPLSIATQVEIAKEVTH